MRAASVMLGAITVAAGGIGLAVSGAGDDAQTLNRLVAMGLVFAGVLSMILAAGGIGYAWGISITGAAILVVILAVSHPEKFEVRSGFGEYAEHAEQQFCFENPELCKPVGDEP